MLVHSELNTIEYITRNTLQVKDNVVIKKIVKTSCTAYIA